MIKSTKPEYLTIFWKKYTSFHIFFDPYMYIIMSIDYSRTDNILNEYTYDILTDSMFEINDIASKHTALSDPVINFFNGEKWILIPLRIMLRFPLIHTKYTDDKTTFDMTLILCPYTLRTTSMKGKFLFNRYVDGIMTLKNTDGEIIRIDIGLKIDDNKNILLNKRYQVKIKTLRNSLIELQDCSYLHLKQYSALVPVISKDYYISGLNINDIPIPNAFKAHFHPKTLVHVIQYLSQSGQNKETIIVGLDATSRAVTGYDTKASGFDNYIAKYYDKIIDKHGYIIPILWLHAKNMYVDAKIIYL
jgi:hypothetical protein